MAFPTNVFAFFWCMYVVPNIRSRVGHGKSELDDYNRHDEASLQPGHESADESALQAGLDSADKQASEEAEADVLTGRGMMNMDWQLITCPVLGALFREGDLVPDNKGRVKRSKVVAAFKKVQIPEHIINGTVEGNFGHLTKNDPKIDMFTMNLKDPANPGKNENKEHTESTGIRDPGPPNQDIYDKFEEFLGGGKTWTLDCMDAAIAHFKEHPNDRGTTGSLGSIKAMAEAFGNGDGTISKKAMKEMYMKSRYPNSFKKRIGL